MPAPFKTCVNSKCKAKLHARRLVCTKCQTAQPVKIKPPAETETEPATAPAKKKKAPEPTQRTGVEAFADMIQGWEWETLQHTVTELIAAFGGDTTLAELEGKIAQLADMFPGQD
jgi:hypothetical protein